MKLGVLADIHANLPALQEVLKQLQEEKVDGYLILGDIIGYGPQPNECLETVQQLQNATVIVGNHDWAAIDLEDITFFNEEARLAIEWTKSVLKQPPVEYLGSLEYMVHNDQFMLVHGSPRDPLDEYLINIERFAASIPFLRAEICFIGHSHLPLYFIQNKESEALDLQEIQEGEEIPLNIQSIHIVNPGSVGQPRDHNPKASFGIFDTETLRFTLKRREYDIAAVQEEMKKYRLPTFLIERLSEGI